MTDLYAAITQTLAPKPELPSLPYGLASLRYFTDSMSDYLHWRNILQTHYPGAVRVRIITEAEYNDEGRYGDYIVDVIASDALGNPVKYEVEGITDIDELAEHWSDNRCDWIIPSGSNVIDLNKPPAAGYWTRESLKEVVRDLLGYLDSLPDSLFRAEEE